jgi:hypothetical protein
MEEAKTPLGNKMTTMNNYPETFEVDRIYKFERIRNGRSEEARLIVYEDGSAGIIGAEEHSYDNGQKAWRSAVRRLQEDGFNFKEAGKIIRMEDFPPQPGEDDLESLRRWAKALRL